MIFLDYFPILASNNDFKITLIESLMINRDHCVGLRCHRKKSIKKNEKEKKSRSDHENKIKKQK